jgi:hypothetical protein
MSKPDKLGCHAQPLNFQNPEFSISNENEVSRGIFRNEEAVHVSQADQQSVHVNINIPKENK